ncbi:MAG: sugar phosphate isomerase/epimerase family protein [Butyricicoccus sp.]
MAKISMNSTATKYCNIVSELKIAKEVGFEGVEITVEKIYRYLEAGYSLESLFPLLEGMEVVGIGALQNIERQGAEYNDYLDDMRRICTLANKLNCKRVQVCTGPSDVATIQDFVNGTLSDSDPRYRGLLGVSEEELIERTAKNIAAGADIAADMGIDLYIEPLAWVPLCKISQALKVIEAAGKSNVGIVIDFWHMWTTGETPEFVSGLDKDLIKIVHICDGISFDGGVPVQDVLRDVWTGEGDIPLKRWIDAVKQTGFDGWYSTEIFSNKIYERDPRQTSALLKSNFEYMLGINV